MSEEAVVQLEKPKTWTCFGRYLNCEVCNSICFQSEQCKENSVMADEVIETKDEIDALLDNLTDGDKVETEVDDDKKVEYAESAADESKKTTTRKAAPKSNDTTVVKAEKKDKPKPTEKPKKTPAELIDEFGSYFTAPFNDEELLKPIATVLRDGICPYVKGITARSSYIKIDSELTRLFIYVPSKRRKDSVRIEIKNVAKYNEKFEKMNTSTGNAIIDLQSEKEAKTFVEIYTGESFEADTVPTSLEISDMVSVTVSALNDKVLGSDSTAEDVKKILTAGGIDEEKVAGIDATSAENLLTESAKLVEHELEKTTQEN